MKALKHRKGVALAVAGVVVAAGAIAVDLPALANTNKGKTTHAKTVKAKTTKSSAGKSAVKTGTTTPPAPPALGDNDGDGHHGFGPGGPGGAQALKEVLADLVTKGTISQEQSDAIVAALQAKRDAMQKAEADFRAKATQVMADVLGLTLDEFNAKRANQTLPEPTDAQRAELRTKLDALRTSLGLPTGGPGMGRPGDGDGDHGPGMGRPGDRGPGMDGPGAGAPGMGMRGHGHHGGRSF